jgi:hypothetical protein
VTSASFEDSPPSDPVEAITWRFRAAWAVPDDDATTPELLPVRLARACVAVLPVDGAGLSLRHEELRIPLGASDDAASMAERLQFTQGEGPCLEAANHQRIVIGGSDQLRDRWPAFAAELVARTPYRAVLALPLRLDETTHGAIDLFFADPDRLTDVGLADAATLAENVGEVLQFARRLDSREAFGRTGEPEPDWLFSSSVEDRGVVWTAMGMLMVRFNVTAADALASLRAHAYGHDVLVDDVSAQLVQGTLDLAELSEPGNR